MLFVGLVLFVESIFLSALAPLLPRFERDLGLSTGAVGVLSAMYPLGLLVATLPGAVLADRRGVRLTTVSGLVVIGVASAAFGLSDEYWQLSLSRFFQGVGSAACWSGAMTWLIAASPEETRGHTIGLAMAFTVAGGLIGPAVGGIATSLGLEPTFIFVGGAAIVLAVIATCVHPPPKERSQHLRVLWAALKRKELLGAMLLMFIPALVLGTLWTLGPLQLDDAGWGTAGIAVIFMLAAAVEMVTSPVAGRWSDRRGRLEPIRVGLLLAIVLTLTLPWIDARWALAVVVIAAGFIFGSLISPMLALLSERRASTGLNSALGIAVMNFAFAPGFFLGPAIGGSVADAVGYGAAYGIMAACSAVALVSVSLGRSQAKETQTLATEYKR